MGIMEFLLLYIMYYLGNKYSVLDNFDIQKYVATLLPRPVFKLWHLFVQSKSNVMQKQSHIETRKHEKLCQVELVQRKMRRKNNQFIYTNKLVRVNRYFRLRESFISTTI
jgi:hypothetical protein